MKYHSVYRIVGHDFNSGSRWILIEDMNGPVSVTNDAENVVRDLIGRGYEGYRILYKDSMGQWSELKHNGTEFSGFGVGFTPKTI